MFKLFRLILMRNLRSVMTLFLVLLLASTGFLTMRELTSNIELLVAKETQPLFGADLRVRTTGYSSGSLIDRIVPFLSGSVYSWGERITFSSTLFDRDGKTGLVNVIAYDGIYPQKGILKKSLLPGVIETPEYVAGTDELIRRFSQSGSIILDTQKITLTHRIVESSDIGFSFANENNLIILPRSLLATSSLISSGSRLSQDLLISFENPSITESIKKKIEKENITKIYQVQTYSDRSENIMDTTKELTNYTLLILVITSLFAGIILRSSHDALFADLSRTLHIVEILGFSRRRQFTLFLLLYILIVPTAFLLSILLSGGLIYALHFIPGAEEFIFIGTPITFTGIIVMILVIVTFLPAWISKSTGWKNLGSKFPLSFLGPRFIPRFLDGFLIFLGGVSILMLIFERFFYSLGLVIVALVILLIIAFILRRFYLFLFLLATRWRKGKFFLFDGIRTLVRPITPTIPITISLLCITTFFVVFILFTLSFQSKLVEDTQKSANIYAINLLERDRKNIESTLTGSTIYSILRARITRINNQTLEEHLGTAKPSPEFTREYNITTTPLDIPILSGSPRIGADEVSVDDTFSKRLDITLGDRIEFLLSGRPIILTVANIRKSVREGFRPFFYFSFDETAFRDAPKTYFLSAYTSDPESWKHSMLEKTGPHVTFIDVEGILTTLREISQKILSVITLFLTVVSLYGIAAISSLYTRMQSIEDMKRHLYPLLGADRRSVRFSLRVTRIMMLIVSAILSLIIGTLLALYIIRTSSILSIDLMMIMTTWAITLGIYLCLVWIIFPRD